MEDDAHWLEKLRALPKLSSPELLGLASLLVLALLAVLLTLDRSWTTFSVLRVAAIKCFIRAKLDLLRKTAVPRRNP